MKHEALLLTTLSTNKAAPKWTIGGGRPGSAGLNAGRPGTPGPGTYANNAANRPSPSFGFGTSRREGLPGSQGPGPGQYQPLERPRSAGPVFKFGSSQRAHQMNGGTPGPGSYTPKIDAARREPPKYHISPLRDVNQRNAGTQRTPGPGSYAAPERPQSAKSSPQWGFGTSERARGFNHSGPGPGSYQTDSNFSKGPMYSIRTKMEKYSGSGGYPQDTPGPGRYGGPYTQFSARDR
jgi:hypothetical protein